MASVSRAIRSFLSPFAIFADGHAEKVTVTCDAKRRPVAVALVTDPSVTLDPSALLFVTGHAVDAYATRRAIGGDKRAVTSRRFVIRPEHVPTAGRRTLGDMARHMATVTDADAYGWTSAERVAFAGRVSRKRDWPVTEG